MVFDDEEAREQLEGQRGDGEEIAGDDRLAVVGEEGRPAAGGIAAAWRAAPKPRRARPRARKADQRPAGSPRRGGRRRYRATLRSETSKPSFKSSPWILGAPQPAFSVARRRIRVRISSLIRGRPPRCRDRQRQ